MVVALVVVLDTNCGRVMRMYEGPLVEGCDFVLGRDLVEVKC